LVVQQPRNIRLFVLFDSFLISFSFFCRHVGETFNKHYPVGRVFIKLLSYIPTEKRKKRKEETVKKTQIVERCHAAAPPTGTNNPIHNA